MARTHPEPDTCMAFRYRVRRMDAQSGSFRPDLGQPLTEGPILELALETLSGPLTLTVRFKYDDYF